MSVPWTRQRLTFVLFGDSITQRGFEDGWVASLANHYTRKADVLNRGYGGYNTRWAFYLLPRVFPEGLDPALITIFFGANDMSLPHVNPQQHVPPDEYQTNLRCIVQFARDRYGPAVRIVLITPAAIHEPGRLQYQESMYGDKAAGVLERTDASAQHYAQLCSEVGQELGLPVVNAWQAFHSAAASLPNGLADLLCDGLHFTPRGNAVLFQELLRVVEFIYPELKAEAAGGLPPEFPVSTDVNWQDPEKTFASVLAPPAEDV
eukprot:EG_transcript_21610